MTQTILITGSTDGIGLEAAKLLIEQGHRVLIHGRNPTKLNALKAQLPQGQTHFYQADLSDLAAVEALAKAIREDFSSLDVLINNAGVFHVNNSNTPIGLDVRFVVNTIAPYALTMSLWDLLGETGRVINLSSAAQAPVNMEAFDKQVPMNHGTAYAQSKLALNMWSSALANAHPQGPAIVAVNPGSMLGTKMVQDGFGVAGGDVMIGANILANMATRTDILEHTGRYYDNDSRRFAPSHPAGNNAQQNQQLLEKLQGLTQR